MLEQVVEDPAIHTLMELYDLLPPEMEAQPEAEDSKNTLLGIPILVEPMPASPPVPARPLFPHFHYRSFITTTN